MFGLWGNGEIKDLREARKFLSQYLEDFLRVKDKVEPDLFEATRFLLQENIDMYASIIELHKKGHFLSCLILGRSILENSINLQYIYRADSEQRAKNFTLYGLMQYKRRMEELKITSEGQIELMKAIGEKLKDYKPSGESKYHWDGKSISKLFTELNLKSLYPSLFGRLSGFTHGSFGNRNFNQDRPYIQLLRGLFTRELFLVVLESLRVVSERFDMEPAIICIDDFPIGATTLFSTNPKKSENDIIGATAK